MNVPFYLFSTSYFGNSFHAIQHCSSIVVLIFGGIMDTTTTTPRDLMEAQTPSPESVQP